MSLTARIEVVHSPSTVTDSYGSMILNAQVFAAIVSAETGQVTNGNNCVVTYTIEENGGLTTNHIIVPGMRSLIYNGEIGRVTFNSNHAIVNSYNKNFEVVSVTGGSEDELPPPQQQPGDIEITSIEIDSEETAPGANNGRITVHATATYLPIAYKLDGLITQAANVFTGVSGGGHTVTVIDANGQSISRTVFLPTVNNLLIADPTVSLPGGNVSRWSAAFNPVVFTYQRRDFAVTSLQLNIPDGKTLVNVNGDMSNVTVGEFVYLNTDAYDGTFKIIAKNGETVVIDVPFKSSSTGFININSLRPYYRVLTRITYFDKITGSENTITSINRPNNKGVTRADISNFLQSILRAQDTSDYYQSNYRDDNLSASYQIAYAEVWDGRPETYKIIEHSYYVLYAARQLGASNGGNLAEFVPFATTPNGVEKAKWVTDFSEPAYSFGYPFDLSFIYSDGLVGRELYAQFTLLDINRNPLPGGPNVSYLLNDDGSWLLNQDSSKLVIARQSQSVTPVPGQLGLNRLLVKPDFDPQAYYINTQLCYKGDPGPAVLNFGLLNEIATGTGEMRLYLIKGNDPDKIVDLTESGLQTIYIYNNDAYEIGFEFISKSQPDLQAGLLITKNGEGVRVLITGTVGTSIIKTGKATPGATYEIIAGLTEDHPLTDGDVPDDDENPQPLLIPVTEVQTIRIDDAVDDQSVYLRWIGLSGSWNYYRFVYNQEVSLDVQNAVIIKNYVSDWENQDSIEEVISKTAGQKIKVVAEDLSVADIKGLQSIKYSPKVQMLVNKNPVKWQTVVINTATYAEYETRNGQAPFSVTFNLPAINIQAQ